MFKLAVLSFVIKTLSQRQQLYTFKILINNIIWVSININVQHTTMHYLFNIQREMFCFNEQKDRFCEKFYICWLTFFILGY